MEARGQKSDAPVTIPGGILSRKSNREHDNTHLRQIGKKPLLKVLKWIIKATDNTVLDD